MTRPVIVDTDPGQDDAVALLLALAADELEVRAVTAVAGNVPLALTAANARRVCELAGRPEVPVHAGCPRPLVREPVTAEHVHGVTGLEGTDLPEPTTALAEPHAVPWLVDTLLAAEPGELTVCALGPLTNLAAALVLEPRIAPRIREVVAMGGGFAAGGNVTPAAEFNVYADPHAAHVVLTSGAPVTLLPLDVTHRALVTAERLEALGALPAPLGPAVAGWLESSRRRHGAHGDDEGAPLHDPTVVARLLEPALFAGRRCHVEVVTDASPALGATIADRRGVTGREPNVDVLDTVDAEGFFALLTDRLARLAASAG